jgi:hypothetical protein
MHIYIHIQIIILGEDVKVGASITTVPISRDNAYIQDLLIGPLVLFILGILSFIFLNIGLLIRCCNRCTCLPVTNPLTNEKDWTYRK